MHLLPLFLAIEKLKYNKLARKCENALVALKCPQLSERAEKFNENFRTASGAHVI